MRTLCALAAASLLACAQGEDEPCQLDSDCDDGLVCLREASSERGVCVDPSDRQPTEPDAGPGTDPELPPDDGGMADADVDPDDGGSEDEDAGR